MLTHICMYGEGSSQGYASFPGKFPHGLQKEFGLKEVQARLGRAAKGNKAVAMHRWDFKDYALFIHFDAEHKRIRSVAIQLPV